MVSFARINLDAAHHLLRPPRPPRKQEKENVPFFSHAAYLPHAQPSRVPVLPWPRAIPLPVWVAR